MGGSSNPSSILDFLINQNQGNSSPTPVVPQQDSNPAPPMPAPPQAGMPSPAPQASAPQSAPSPAQAQAGGIKGYLSNIFYNMGEAAKAHLGMPTDVQVQQGQQKIDLQRQQINADTAIKQQQLDQMKQTVTLPNGMQVPFGLAKPYLDFQAKQYTADAGARAKIAAETIGKRFIPIPGVGMFDTQDSSGNPTLVPGSNPLGVTVTDAIAKEYGIPDQLKGKTIPMQQFSQFLRGSSAWAPTVTNTTETKELGNGSIVQIPKTTTSQKVAPGQAPGTTPPASNSAPTPPASLTTRGGVKTLVGSDGQPLQGKSAPETVYAFDPKTNQTISTTRADAAAKGLQVTANKVSATQVRKDESLSNRVADVQRKVGDFADTFNEPIDDADKAAIAYLMQHAPVGSIAHMGEIPLAGFANNLLKAAGIAKLSDAGMKRFIGFNQARESLSGYQQVLTNSSHSSDKVLELQLEQLPSPIADKDYANLATGEFQKNIDLAGQHIPIFPGSAETQQSIKAQQVARRTQAQAIQNNQQQGQQAQTPPTTILKEGIHTTFKNGQTWTLKNGQSVRVK